MHTSIDRAGRVVIPKSIRDRAGFPEGAVLEVRLRDGVVELALPSVELPLVREGELLVYRTGTVAAPLTREVVSEAIATLREERGSSEKSR